MASKGYLIRFYDSGDLEAHACITHAEAVRFIGQFEGEMVFHEAIRINEDATWDDVSETLIQEYFNDRFTDAGDELDLYDVRRDILPCFPQEHHKTIRGCLSWAEDCRADDKRYGSYRDDVEATWSAGRL